MGGIPELSHAHGRICRSSGTPGGQCTSRRPQGGVKGAGGYAQWAVCFRKLFQDFWRASVDRPADGRRGRSGGSAAGGGDELSYLAGQIRLRSLGDWRQLPDQWASIHGYRRGGAGILRGEAGRVGYAGFLAARHDGTVDLWSGGTAEKTEWQLPGLDRESASGGE